MWLFRLVVLVCAIFLLHSPVFAKQFPPADPRDLAELVELVGMGAQARVAADFAQEAIEVRVAAGKMEPAEGALRKRLAQKAYDAQYIIEFLSHEPKPRPRSVPLGHSFADYPGSHVSRPNQMFVDKMLEQYRKPMFQKIVAMENRVMTPEGHERIKRIFHKPLEEQASAERIAIVKRLLNNAPFVPANLNGLYINNRFVLNYVWGSDIRPFPQLESVSANWGEMRRHYVLSGMIDAYRDLSNEELKVYAQSVHKNRVVLCYLFKSLNSAIYYCQRNTDAFLVDEYLTLTGFRDQARNTEDFMLHGMQEAVDADLEDAKQMEEAVPYVESAYAENLLLESMAQKVQVSYLGHREAFAWYQSKLGRKIVTLENEATTVKGHLAIQEASLQPVTIQASEQRLALIDKLLQAHARWGCTLYVDSGVPLNNRIALNLWLSGRFKGTRFAAVATQEKGIDPHTFPSPERRQHYIRTGLIWAYRSLSDSELEHYIAFICQNSDLNRLLDSYNEALLAARGELIVLMKLAPGAEADVTDPEELRAELLDYGPMQVKALYGRKDEGNHLGSVQVVRDPVILDKTDRITARLGGRFGVTYVVRGGTRGRSAQLKVRVTHPPITNPDKGHSARIDGWATSFVLGQVSMDGWVFEYPWEMVPGNWKFEILAGERILLKKTFTVTVAKSATL